MCESLAFSDLDKYELAVELLFSVFFFQAEDGIRDVAVTGVQTCALPIFLAAAALMIDYVLTVAVGISAGVGALVSAIPSLQSHTLTICLGILVLITLINLRGMRDAGLVFMAPTYLFVGTLLAAILIGLIKTFVSGGHPVPVEPLPRITQATALPGAWLILQAFARGCTAMTGVEAVSNGVKTFREPVVSNARRSEEGRVGEECRS